MRVDVGQLLLAGALLGGPILGIVAAAVADALRR